MFSRAANLAANRRGRPWSSPRPRPSPRPPCRRPRARRARPRTGSPTSTAPRPPPTRRACGEIGSVLSCARGTFGRVTGSDAARGARRRAAAVACERARRLPLARARASRRSPREPTKVSSPKHAPRARHRVGPHSRGGASMLRLRVAPGSASLSHAPRTRPDAYEGDESSLSLSLSDGPFFKRSAQPLFLARPRRGPRFPDFGWCSQIPKGRTSACEISFWASEGSQPRHKLDGMISGAAPRERRHRRPHDARGSGACDEMSKLAPKASLFHAATSTHGGRSSSLSLSLSLSLLGHSFPLVVVPSFCAPMENDRDSRRTLEKGGLTFQQTRERRCVLSRECAPRAPH